MLAHGDAPIEIVGTRLAPRPRRLANKIAQLGSLKMSMSDRDGKIWLDGELVEWRNATIHVLSHTLHYGCGAFEGVHAYNAVGGTAIFRLEEHHRTPLQ